ncbi:MULTISPECIES: Crp/Fnr family transcriptional regulator [unclassified Myroides]|uniref:Crp/Fnr family transcriptional regulator n=1 Tax=unclassified Myroides TaxID=2642485 RepID=UPI0015FE0BA7|nr:MULTISPECIES: Crp/Fnr family transcriptional regulator [unclassified Myroides]MBB1149657.1 Crp/Fnr family transcriptional regulator [Myroides sp. NP-2]MDM1407129.1 Crp/Fnr family transcriptional regulator [Myroides sp. DF42-4-2]
MIDPAILLRYCGFIKEFDKSETVFTQGEEPRYYFQIMHGRVKMNNYNEDGKEFIQGLFTDGESFGEPPLFCEVNYPANAVTLQPTSIILIHKRDFYTLLEREKSSCFSVLKALSSRLYYKSIMAPDISSNDSEKRILTLLNYIKTQHKELTEEFYVDLTRQQIADMTGLRVETVIRTIKEMEANHLIRLERGKLFF